MSAERLFQRKGHDRKVLFNVEDRQALCYKGIMHKMV